MLVTGCAVNIDADHYADIDERVRCETDKKRVPVLARKLVENASNDRSEAAFRTCVDTSFKGPSTKDTSNPPIRNAQLSAIRAGGDAAFRTRVDLKIQDGCNNACAFCIVHTARGPARSMPAREVIEQAQVLAENGVNELVLVGIDLAAYHDGAFELSDLIEELEAQTDIARIRISSVEPQSMTPALIRTLANSDGRVCRHLHLCLQSGSTKVLAEMNRHYTAQGFEKLVDRLRGEVPNIALSTDVIVGFPGETDEDFQESYKLIKRSGFMRLHVFRYSKRPGTPAAARADQVNAQTKAARAKQLIELGDALALEDMQRRLGTTEQTIIERPGLGTSESYHPVSCNNTLELGSLAMLEFTDIDTRRMRLIGKET